MEKQVIKFFKRNSEAKVCHLVLLEVFGDMGTAKKFAKSRNAYVRSFTRAEYDQWLQQKVNN